MRYYLTSRLTDTRRIIFNDVEEHLNEVSILMVAKYNDRITKDNINEELEKHFCNFKIVARNSGFEFTYDLHIRVGDYALRVIFKNLVLNVDHCVFSEAVIREFETKPKGENHEN